MSKTGFLDLKNAPFFDRKTFWPQKFANLGCWCSL